MHFHAIEGRSHELTVKLGLMHRVFEC
jgi:hypothetical protein